MEINANSETLEDSYLSGLVVHVIFRNEENGYTVLKVKVKESNPEIKDKTVTVVGFFPSIERDERYRFEGLFKEHPRFGKQYQANMYQKQVPTEQEALISYLSSDRFQGIGKKTAQSIVETIGNHAITKILDHPHVLDDVPGLNEKKRKQLYEQLLENQGMEKAMMALSKYGFGMDLSVRIYQTYQEQTLDMIQHYPYQLVWDVQGVGFGKADKLGNQVGISGNDLERIKAGIYYELHEKSIQNGNVYIPIHELIQSVWSLLNKEKDQVTKQEIEKAILFLDEEGVIVIEEDHVYIKSLYYAEKGFVSNVRRLILSGEDREPFPEQEFLQALGETEEMFDLQYAEQQKEAIQKALHSSIMVLTGGPGTGKTTVIRAIVQMFSMLYEWSLDPHDYKKDDPFPFLLAAPTGRAAKRMKESTGMNAVTIHKLLGYNGEDEESFEKDEANPLEGKVLIIDEVSMVDMWLANQLFRSIPDGMQVILVGDEDQLPSVGPGQVLTDILASEVIPTVSLSVVYRQAEGSSIIDLAHQIKQNKLPEDLHESKEDRRFFVCPPEQIADAVVQVCEGAKRKGYSASEIQVLAPMYKGPAGINTLNERLQQLFNPPTDQRREVQYGDVVYRTGDVVLQLVNNPEQQVFNGDRGEIVTIFYAKETEDKQMQIVVSFDGTEVTYAKQELHQLTHAYCSSIHKAQGSEFPIVVLPIGMSFRRMLRKKLIYTAVTRARDYLIICGEVRALSYSLDNDDEDIRYTQLTEKLTDIVETTPQYQNRSSS